MHGMPRQAVRWGALMIAAAALAAGCSLYRQDRCYVPREQYLMARDLFIETGSLELVQRRMEQLQWRRCRINEVLYRLGKEFEVLPEAIERTPAPTPTPAPPAQAERPYPSPAGAPLG